MQRSLPSACNILLIVLIIYSLNTSEQFKSFFVFFFVFNLFFHLCQLYLNNQLFTVAQKIIQDGPKQGGYLLVISIGQFNFVVFTDECCTNENVRI